MLRNIARTHLKASQKRWSSSSAALERDVVIVGGGPAGLALANALASSSSMRTALKVTLVEASDLKKVEAWSPSAGEYSNRASSITNSSRAFLQATGAWERVDQSRTCAIEEMQVWDGVSDARITFSPEDAPVESSSQLARMTENLNLQRALIRSLSQYPGVEMIDKVRVQSIVGEDREGGGWPLVHLSDGRILRARLLVGADGFNSPVRAYSGIKSYGWAYDTHGVVATLFHPPTGPLQGPNTVAYQRFLPTGPIAFLPLSETASSLVWSTKPALAASLKQVDPSIFAQMVNCAFRLPHVSLRYLHERIAEGSPLSPAQFQEELAFREQSHMIDNRSALSSLRTDIGGIPPDGADAFPPLVRSVQAGSIASFPLRFSHADSYIGDRTVLVGDAAHTIHPLAGQGLNLGLGDVECLVRCIEKAHALGGDIGSHTALAPYARERYLANHTMLSVCDKLHKLYSVTAEPAVWARSVGLEVLNELDAIKGALMMTAGTSSSRYGSPQAGWELAAKGVETFAKSVNIRTLGNSVSGVVGSAMQQLLRSRGSTGTRQDRP